MKRIISLIVLVQVGSKLVVNPQFVVGLEAIGGSSCKTEVILQTGTGNGYYPSVCSDWSPAQIIVALQEGSLVNVK